MTDRFPTAFIYFSSPSFYKIICYDPKITSKHLNLFICQKCDLKYLDLIIAAHDPFHSGYPVLKALLTPPWLISKVEHQSHDLVPFISGRFQQLFPVRRSIIADHPQRHVMINGCLVLQSKKHNPGSADPQLQIIPLLLMEFTVIRLILRSCLCLV